MFEKKSNSKRIRPMWLNHLGCFHLYIHNDKDEKLAERFAKHNGNLIVGLADAPMSRIYCEYSQPLYDVLKKLNRLHKEWHIEYEECGDDLDNHCLATFNEHRFDTIEAFKEFCTSYYDEANKKREHDWWACRMGEAPMPMEHDGTIEPSNCQWCQRCEIKRVNHKIENGIESYTPIYGCKYNGKKCKPLAFEDDEK